MADATTQEQPHESDSNKPLTTRKAPRIGKSFTSRNPLPIGIIGLVFLLVLLIAAFNAAKLPLIGGGTASSKPNRNKPKLSATVSFQTS